MLILPDEDPYYFNSSYSFKQDLYNLYYRWHTSASLWKIGCVEPVAGTEILEVSHRKITVQFSCLNSISRRGFYEFLQKRETASSSCSGAKQVLSAGWGHLWGNCSQEAPFGFCIPTGMFLNSRKRLYLFSTPLSQLFQIPLFHRSLSNAGCCKTRCANWWPVYLGSVFLTLATKQAGSDEGVVLNIFFIPSVS